MLCHDLPFCIQLHYRTFALASPPACSVRSQPHSGIRLTSRAVDNQMFVAMCSVARNPEASYQAVCPLLTRAKKLTPSTDIHSWSTLLGRLSRKLTKEELLSMLISVSSPFQMSVLCADSRYRHDCYDQKEPAGDHPTSIRRLPGCLCLIHCDRRGTGWMCE